jgi:hypothetical protein
VADWYTSSAAYAAIAAFVPSVAYTVGQIVKPTAPALKAQWAFRCTTAGTASTEPTWPTGNNATIATGGATFTNVTGQSTYGWGAAAGDLPTLLGAVGANRFVAGDRIFVSSDHSETQTAATTYGATTAPASYASGQVLSVNRAGSVPPAAADLTVGATVTVSGAGTMTFESYFPVYHYGVNYTYTGTSANGISFNNSGVKTQYFDSCQLYLNTATAAVRFSALAPASITLFNTTLRFGSASQAIQGGTGSLNLEIVWLSTPSAIAGVTIPSILFLPLSTTTHSVTARGVDLSAITGTLVQNGGAVNSGGKYLFDSCRIAAGVVRLSGTNMANTRDLVELINCYDGTNIINESYQPAGAVTTERTITLSGGATDDVGIFSHKLVSGTNIDKYVNPLLGFWMDVENTAIGVSKTATVEIISSASLNNDDISLLLEYQGTSGSPVASFGNTLPATVLTANAAVAASTATWNASPATPIRQRLQVTFTPRVAGRVRGQVRLGRPSTTVYIDPAIAIS